MTRLLPALHEGHAPIHFHLAFEDALEAFEAWLPEEDEPHVLMDDKYIPISAVFGRMRTCSDLLPQRLCDLIEEVLGKQEPALDGENDTYANAAVLLRALCVERLRGRAAKAA